MVKDRSCHEDFFWVGTIRLLYERYKTLVVHLSRQDLMLVSRLEDTFFVSSLSVSKKKLIVPGLDRTPFFWKYSRLDDPNHHRHSLHRIPESKINDYYTFNSKFFT